MTKPTSDELHDFALYLRQCTNRQVMGVWEKETYYQRSATADLAIAEAQRRQIDTTVWRKPTSRRPSANV